MRWGRAFLVLMSTTVLAGCVADGGTARPVTQGAVAQAPAPSAPATAAAALPPGVIKLDPAQLLMAQAGNAKAQNEVGANYLINSFLNPQQKTAYQAEAAKWFRAAADKGDATGRQNLGQLYNGGYGVPLDKAEAVRLFRLSADQGLAAGQYALATSYITGGGVSLDYTEARTWLLKAAAQNHADALTALGGMYEKGQGVTVDYAESARWYQRAADRGNPMAADNLAGDYATGRGVPQDMTLAYFWYHFAALRLTNKQQKEAATVNRNFIATKLNSSEIEQAQAVARTWKIGVNVAAAMTGAPSAVTPGPLNPGSATLGTVNTGPAKAQTVGTGFAVSKAGHVLTNAHVVGQCREIHTHLPGGIDQMAELVAKDDQNDLAVLKLSSSPSRVATFRGDAGVRQGDNIVVYGFPLGEALAADGNLTTGNVSALSGLRNDSRMLQVSAPVQPGNSGGPLVDMSGNVVGVVVSKLNAVKTMVATGDIPQNVNFAIKASVARDFLDANGIAYQSVPSTQPLTAADVGDRVKRFTLKVECWR